MANLGELQGRVAQLCAQHDDLARRVERLTSFVANTQGTVLTRVDTTLGTVDRDLRELMKVIRGNGVVGIVARVDGVETAVKDMKASIDRIAKSVGSATRNRVQLAGNIIAALAVVVAAVVAIWGGK